MVGAAAPGLSLRALRAQTAAGLLILALLAGARGAEAELFVSSADTDEVLRYGDDGAFLGVFAAGGGLVRPQGLAFGLDGHLYVASSGAMDSKVLRYDGATGALVDVFVAVNSGELSLPRGLAFGPDGHLYVASENNNRVLRFHGVTGAFLGSVTPTADPAQEPKGPRGLTFGADGRLYVVSFGDSRVKRYDPPGDATADVFVEFDAGEGRPDGPFDLSFGPDGHLYVGADGNNAVFRYNGTSGAFIDVFVAPASGGLATPRGILFGPDGGLYVASRDNDRVQRYDGTTGGSPTVFVAEQAGGLDFPTFLAVRRPAGRVLCVRPGGTAPDFGTIQGALDAAGLGDTIRVAGGTYEEHVTVARTVTLEGGWDATCENRDLAAFVTTIRPPPGVPPGTERSVVQVTAVAPILDGVTITGSRADLGGQHGGGLALRETHATVRNSVITGNKAFLFGGGIWAQRGAPRLVANRIESNEVLGAGTPSGGGGVALEDSAATLDANLIAGNVAGDMFHSGGGVLVNGGGPVVLRDGDVRGNRVSPVGGGGVVIWGPATVTVEGGSISGNVAGAEPVCGGGGGGLAAGPDVTLVLDRVSFEDNCSADASVVVGTSTLVARNVLVARNRSTAPHIGGLLVFDTLGILTNITLANNAGTAIQTNASLVISNAIVVGHAKALVAFPPGIPLVAFSDFFANDVLAEGITVDPALGNRFDDPRLGPDLAPLPGSPAIDGGTNDGCPGLDLRGIARPRDGNGDSVATCDMGAFEGPTLAVALDLDGDRKAEVGVFDARLAEWRMAGESGLLSPAVFGGPGDRPVPGDYDGDGRLDLAVFRPGTGEWLVLGSTAGPFVAATTGTAGDEPVPADYDGDGRTDPAVFRAGEWRLQRSAAGLLTVQVGGPGSIPVPADYDGDGKADVAVFVPVTGEWLIVGSASGMTVLSVAAATPGQLPVPGDYDGDGRADPALYAGGRAGRAGDPSSRWLILGSRAGPFEIVLDGAGPGDVPVPADYDGDSRTDAAVYRRRTGTWLIRGSEAGSLTRATGPPRRADVPLGRPRTGRAGGGS